MGHLACAAATLAACSFSGESGGTSDGDLCGWPYQPDFIDPCTPRPGGDPATELTSPGTYVLDTDAGTLTDPDGSVEMLTLESEAGAAALWTSNLIVGAASRLRAVGSRPLLVISTGAASVSGTIDVSSKQRFTSYELGAGADGERCPDSPPDPGLGCGSEGASGGGGAGLGAAGGNGGRGGETHDCGAGNPDGIDGGAGGVAVAVPEVVEGGCAGADGGPSDQSTEDVGAGGPGGGAIFIVSRLALEVTGRIEAGGAGGRGATGSRSGGGGGGSGGLIGLEGASVTIGAAALITANGGGGGGGCDNKVAGDGSDALPSPAAAGGGAPEGMGGAGGAGGHVARPAGQSGAASTRGGGGGGGSVGFIILRGPEPPTVDGTLSPAAS